MKTKYIQMYWVKEAEVHPAHKDINYIEAIKNHEYEKGVQVDEKDMEDGYEEWLMTGQIPSSVARPDDNDMKKTAEK